MLKIIANIDRWWNKQYMDERLLDWSFKIFEDFGPEED